MSKTAGARPALSTDMASLSKEKQLPQTCSFCPTSIMRTFDDKMGLFQHCIAIGEFNSDPEIVRAHSIFLNDLKEGVCDQDVEVKIVWPWMGILMNIDCELVGKKHGNGKSINNSLWNVDLKSCFAHLNPRGVQAVPTQGFAVLDFGHDLLGFFDAQDFEKAFVQCQRGKYEFERRKKHRKEQTQEIFGWIADENDYNQMSPVGKYLRKRGALRVKPRFRRAWTGEHDILLQDVQFKLQQKNIKFALLGKEVCSLRTSMYQEESKKHSAEARLLLLKSKHKQELDAINERMNKVLKFHNDELVKEKEKNYSLQAELKSFQEKCRHLEEKNTQRTSDETELSKLIDLVEENEALQDLVHMLIYKEREINDKFQSAMEAAKEVLQEDARLIGIKKVGHMKDGPWQKAFAKKFKGLKGGWEISCAETFFLWNEVYLRDPFWYPYKVVLTEDGKFEEHMDTKDKRLAKLHEEFGTEVWQTVVDALNELREFNPSGRYPISVPWHFDQGRAARLDEIIRHLAFDDTKSRESSLG